MHLHGRVLLMLAAVWGLVFSFQDSAQAARSRDFSDFDIHQKKEDFDWVVGQINEYYGLLDYKQQTLGWNWDQLQNDYWQKASADSVDRDQFGALMLQMIAELKDAHSGAYYLRPAMVDGWRIRTLGVWTERGKTSDGADAATVSMVFPSVVGWDADIQQGDNIVAIGGKSVDQMVKDEILPYRNLGQDQSNLTFGLSYLTFRFNDMFVNLPSGKVTVTVDRGGKKVDIPMQWFDVDFYTLLQDLFSDKVKTKVNKAAFSIQKIVGKKPNGKYIVEFRKPVNTRSMEANPFRQNGLSELPLSKVKTFINPEIRLAAMMRKAAFPGQDYPTAGRTDVEYNGIPFSILQTKNGLVAVYRVDDFEFSRFTCGDIVWDGDFGFAECWPLMGEDYASAFNKLKTNLGVNTLILDLRGNPGGFLDLGYQLVRAFNAGQFPVNLASVRLNEEWLMEFNWATQDPFASLAEKATYQTILDQLNADIKAGKKFSSPVSIEGDDHLKGVQNPWAGKTYILADEMCASMCDIFTTLMQDLKDATVIGTQTMGAGGNVEWIGTSPHTKIDLDLTASRILRLNGDSIENHGAAPDITLTDLPGDTYWSDLLKLLNKTSSISSSDASISAK